MSRVIYYKLLTNSGTRHDLIYLTSDGHVTDQDVIAD